MPFLRNRGSKNRDIPLDLSQHVTQKRQSTTAGHDPRVKSVRFGESILRRQLLGSDYDRGDDDGGNSDEEEVQQLLTQALQHNSVHYSDVFEFTDHTADLLTDGSVGNMELLLQSNEMATDEGTTQLVLSGRRGRHQHRRISGWRKNLHRIRAFFTRIKNIITAATKRVWNALLGLLVRFIPAKRKEAIVAGLRHMGVDSISASTILTHYFATTL